jgi:hypothetical protein
MTSIWKQISSIQFAIYEKHYKIKLLKAKKIIQIHVAEDRDKENKNSSFKAWS